MSVNLSIFILQLSPPSAVVSKELTAAEAKEAEANASNDLTVSVITVSSFITEYTYELNDLKVQRSNLINS